MSVYTERTTSQVKKSNKAEIINTALSRLDQWFLCTTGQLSIFGLLSLYLTNSKIRRGLIKQRLMAFSKSIFCISEHILIVKIN